MLCATSASRPWRLHCGPAVSPTPSSTPPTTSPDFAQLARRDGQTPGGWQEVSAAEFRDEVMALARGLLADGVRPGTRVARDVPDALRVDVVRRTRCGRSASQLVPVYPTVLRRAAALHPRTAPRSPAIVVEHEAPRDDRGGGLRRGGPRCRRLWQLDLGLRPAALIGGGHPAVRGRTDAPAAAHAVDTGPGRRRSVYTSGTTGTPARLCDHPRQPRRGVRHPATTGWGGHASPRPAMQPSLLDFLPVRPHLRADGRRSACLRGGVTPRPSARSEPRRNCCRRSPRSGRRSCSRCRTSSRRSAPAARPHRRGGGPACGTFDAADDGRGALRGGHRGRQAHRHRAADPSPFTARPAHAALRPAGVHPVSGRSLGGRVRTAVSGGSHAPPRAGAALRRRRCHRLRRLRPHRDQRARSPRSRPARCRFGTVGRPMPGCAVHIAEDGEVWVRGAVVFAGYLDEADAPDSGLYDGWLATGDLGRPALSSAAR